jgi:subtilisin family serine protease
MSLARLALAALAFILSGASPAQAQPRGAEVSALAERARQQGSARVILELRATPAMATSQAKPAIRASQDRAVRDLAAHGLRRLRQYEHVPFVAAEMSEAALRAALVHPDVAAVHEDRLHRPMLGDSGPLVGAPEAWSLGFTGSGQQIAILDTGVDRFHPFLAGKVVHEACFSSTFGPDSATTACPNGQESQIGTGAAAPCSAQDDCFHGTHVAGIAAGNGPSAAPAQSFSGIARDAGVIAIQVFSVFTDPQICGTPAPCALAYFSDLIAALDYLVGIRASFSIAAVNMSLGGGFFTSACDTDPMKPPIDQLRSAGIATVVASGNNGFIDALSSPACISSVISVGATTKAPESVASFTNRSSLLKLLAPGVSIHSSVPGGAYASFSGTSMATPHVAGAVALLKQKRPAATVDQVLDALASTGVGIPDPFVGSKPRIRLPQALNAIIPTGPVLAVSPAEGLVASGPPGGPFSPLSKSYTLTNTGVGALNFSASSAAPWVTVSPAGGALAEGASTTVTVSIDAAAAASLPAGVNSSAVSFTNTSNAVGNTTRPLTLNVVAPIPVGTNALVLFSQAGDFIGLGQNRQILGTQPGVTITASRNFQGGVNVDFLLPGGQHWSTQFAPAPGLGAQFAVGAYENAVRFPFNNALSPGLSVSGDGRGCNTLTGRFEVLDLAFSPVDGSVLKFAADFAQHCEGFEPALFGQVRFNSNVPIDPESALPASFSFFPVADVALGAQVMSNAVSITGIANAPVRVQGGEYSIDGGAFTSAPGSIFNGQSLRLRLTASSLPGTPVFATVKVGAAMATFQATTVVAAGTNMLYFHSNPGDYIGQGQQRGLHVGTGFTVRPAPGTIPGRNFHNGVSFSIEGGGDSWGLDFAAPQGAQLAAGSYENAVRFPFENGLSPGLSLSGEGRGCNQLTGRFDVLEVAYNANGTLQRFAADFVQHCEGGLPALFGQIRFNSAAAVYTDPVLPVPFAFVDNFDALPNTLVPSNAVTISGISTAPIRVQGGEYSINGGAFTSAPGTVANGQAVAVRVLTGSVGTASFATVRIGAASATFQAIAGTGQQGAVTGMHYHSQPGDFVGQGAQRSFVAATGFTLTPSRNFHNGVSFRIEGNGEFWNLDFGGPGGAPLAAGSYENAVRFPFESGSTPGVSLTGGGRGCNSVKGRFDVLEVAYGADGRVIRFAADFVQHCEGGAPGLFGQIRYNANTPMNTAPALPAPFSFIPALDVPRGVTVTSNTVSIFGIATAPISVQGGQYSINGGAFTSAAGTIANGQTVTLRLTSSTLAGTAAFATVKIGAASGTFQATTVIANVGTNVLFFRSTPGDFIGLGQTRFMHSGTNFVLTPGRNFDNGVSFSISGSGQFWSLDFAAGDLPSSPALVPGAYEGATRFPFQAPNQPGLSFSGDGRGCNSLTGRFDVLDASYGAGGVVNSFAANFEQHCEGGPAALFGRIRYNTSVPLFGSIRRDHSGDGKSDILWRNSATGENYLYPMNGTAILATEGFLRTVADQSWQVVGTGDFDGDGKADILWRNSATGQNYIYFMDGRTIRSSEGFIRTVAEQSWSVAGVGDFDGDGKDDILWRNAATGETYVYFMDGKTIKPSEGYLRTVADPNWQIAGVGDFDGDGKADIVWRNSVTGQNYLYPVDGLSIKPSEGFIRTVADVDWKIAGVADFDGDGVADILWRHGATGENYLYPMIGTSVKPSEGFLRTVADLNWQIVATGDYDGDGKSDILWRHSASGQNYVYPMDGKSIKPTEGFIRSVPAASGWTVVGR